MKNEIMNNEKSITITHIDFLLFIISLSISHYSFLIIHYSLFQVLVKKL